MSSGNPQWKNFQPSDIMNQDSSILDLKSMGNTGEFYAPNLPIFKKQQELHFRIIHFFLRLIEISDTKKIIILKTPRSNKNVGVPFFF